MSSNDTVIHRQKAESWCRECGHVEGETLYEAVGPNLPQHKTTFLCGECGRHTTKGVVYIYDSEKRFDNTRNTTDD